MNLSSPGFDQSGNTTKARARRPAPQAARSRTGARSRRRVGHAALINKLAEYLTPAELKKVKEAYRFSDEMHLGQVRKSGEPYISHPIAVAEICADWKLDAQAIMAALLHDVIEDQDVKKEELIERFGAAGREPGRRPVQAGKDRIPEPGRGAGGKLPQDAAGHGVRRARHPDQAGRPPAQHAHAGRDGAGQEAPHRRRDDGSVRADRAPPRPEQHLPRTAGPVVLAPVPAALPHPGEGGQGGARQPPRSGQEDPRIGQEHAGAAGIEAEVYGREKTLFGIYKKMRNKHLSFSQVLDVYGFRVVVDTLPELLRGARHPARPVQADAGQVQGLHRDPQDQRLPVAAHHPDRPLRHPGRIPDPHPGNAPHRGIGVAAHWLYKTGDQNMSDLQQRTHAWLQSLLDIQQQTGDSAEFLEHVKVDLFPDSVYVFTPKSKIIALPRGATALDFAYSIHTGIGDHTVSVKINNEPAQLRTELRNGDIVEIVTDPNSRPSPTWLSLSAPARRARRSATTCAPST
jgi:guanosine-3',5'-bis(diphosphate) 3'-pyrophosphohydrolase